MKVPPIVMKRIGTAISELTAVLADLQTFTAGHDSIAPDSSGGEQYLSVKELSSRIPYREQTIRNLMSAGEFEKDVHYLRRRGRVIFRWSAVERWMAERRTAADEPFVPAHHARTRQAR